MPQKWLIFIALSLATLTACAFLAPGYLRLANDLWRQFRSYRWYMQIAILCVMILTVQIAAKKPELPGGQSQERLTLPSIGMTSSAATGRGFDGAPMSSATNILVNSQMISGYALSAIKTNNIAFVEFGEDSHPVNAWTNWALSDDVVWLPHAQMPEFDIYAGTSRVHDIFISSSGVIGLNALAGGPEIGGTNGLLPTSQAKSLAAILNTPLAIIPNLASKVWTQTSPTSLVIAFDSVFAGRNSSNELSFQAEFFDSRWDQSDGQGQDVFFRYNMNSNTVNSTALKSALVGLQGNYPGYEQLTFTASNAIPRQFELRFTGFGYLDPDLEDHDGDGLSSSDEIFIHKTNPHMRDSDMDGMDDNMEVAIGSDPNNPDSDGDTIPDGAEAPGQVLIANTIDADGDGILDSWEKAWFGSTGVIDSAYGDYNSDGMANIINMLTATDPAAVPPPGFALTNGVTAAGYDVWQISSAFSLRLPDGLTNILNRTLEVNRTSPWQQFFISSDKNAGSSWALDGISLAWRADSPANLTGNVTGSPYSDSLRLELGTNLVSSLSFSLNPTRTNGFVYCPKPLYLIRWTPELTFAATNDVKIVTRDNQSYVTAILSKAAHPALPFSITNQMPHKTSSVSSALWDQISMPPYADSTIFPVFTDNLSGHLTARQPATAELPAAAGNSLVNVLIYNPVVKFNNGITVGRPLGDLSRPYPLNSAATRRTWRNHSEATGTLIHPIEVSLGVECDFADVIVDGQLIGGTVRQPLGVMAAPAGCRGEICECADDYYIEITILGETIWYHCEPNDYVEEEEDESNPPPPDPPCDGCDCDEDGPHQGSLKFRVKLGEPGYDQVAGYLWFAFENPVPITTNIFQLLSGPDVDVSTSGGVTSYTSAAPDGAPLLRTIENISNGVLIQLYNSEGEYDHMWRITNPGGYITVVQIIKSENRPGDAYITPALSETHTYDPLSGDWSKTDNLKHFNKTLTISGDFESQGWRSETTTLKDNGGTTLAETVIERSVLGLANSAVTRVTKQQTWDGYNNCYQTSHSLYWVDNQNSRRHGRLKLRHGDNIPWEYHFYDDRGRAILNAGPLYGSTHPAALESGGAIDTIQDLQNIAGLTCVAELLSHAPIAGSGDTDNSQDSSKPRAIEKHIIENGNSTLISREWHVYKRGGNAEHLTLEHTVIRAATQSSAMNDPANQRTISTSIADDPATELILRGRPLTRLNPDGTLETCLYDLDSVSEELTVITHNGTSASPYGVAEQSTYSVEYIDTNYGHTIGRETFLYNGQQGADILLSDEIHHYDCDGHLVSSEYSDGTVSSNLWGCCHLEKSVARDGTITAYNEWPGSPNDSEVVYFSQAQLPGANEHCPADYTTTDAIGREIQSIRYMTDINYSYRNDYAMHITTTAYHFGTDNFSVTTDPMGIATTNITIQSSAADTTVMSRAGVTTTSTTIAGGASLTTTEWRDPVSDENLRKMTKTESTFQPNGWEKRTSYVKYDDGAWITQSETVTDMLGQTLTSSRAGTGGAMLTNSNVYDTAGLLVRTISHDGSSTVFNYNELGERTATISVAAGQTLDFNPQSFTLPNVIALGKYIISETTERTESTEGEWWRINETISYRPGENALTTSVQRTQLTGLTLECNSRAMSTDIDGNTTVITESLNPGNASKITVSVDTTFALTNTTHYVAGYATCSSNSLGGVTAHLYDGFARRIKTTNYANSRELKSMTTYHSDGSLATVGEVTASGTNTTSYSMRQPVIGEPDVYKITVTDSQGHQTINYYSGAGDLYRSEGATYPVAYVKNAAGQMKQLHTWRDEGGDSDITRWYYDLFTGAVTSKLYANGKGTVYTYLSDGRIASRLWARNITSSYGYNDTAAGSIRTTEYSDATPSVTNTFNLTGQLRNVMDGTGATKFGYDTKGRQVAETNALAIITRSYDTFGRYSQCVLDPAYPGYPSLIIQYGYDIFNRLDTVTAIIGAETNTFTYSYIHGTTLISGYTALTSSTPSTPSTILTVSKTYEPYRDLITAITNSVGSVPSVVSSFNYDNDTTGKRTARSDYYNGSIIANTFGFNARGETTNAVMNSDTYDYDFDGIGNRTTSSVNSVISTYTANQLNQYTSVNSAGSARTITHDLDGNLTFNGSEWHHSYDGENRLIKSNPHSVTNGAYMFEYRHNYKNLRVEKVKKQLSGREAGYPMDPTADPGTWDAIETRKYIWDNFNIAGEIVIDHETFVTNISFYTWGLDLSGTLQGAGGVGGLLCETKISDSNTNTYYSLSDANGNVTEYIDQNGIVKAHSVHSAFGETQLSGSMKDDFTHWFSSKPLDHGTGLVQFQERNYLPPFGCWTSRDRIGIRGGLKENGFVQNNCINDIDLLGRINAELNEYFKGAKSKYSIASFIEVRISCMPKNIFTGSKPIRRGQSSFPCDGGSIKIILVPRIEVPPEIRPPLPTPGRKIFGGAYGRIGGSFDPNSSWKTPNDFWGAPAEQGYESNGWGTYPIYTYPNAKFNAGIFVSKLARDNTTWALESFHNDLFKTWYKMSNTVSASQINYSVDVNCGDRISIQVGDKGNASPLSRNQTISITK